VPEEFDTQMWTLPLGNGLAPAGYNQRTILRVCKNTIN
jgi:hypothetical protein